MGTVVGVVLLSGVLLLFSWMIDETQFPQPSAEFDELTEEIDALPGVTVIADSRWIEAPFLSTPTSWVSLTVEERGFAGLLDAACATDHPDVVSWSITVRTESGSDVSLSTPFGASPGIGVPTCPDFGFDAVALVDELDALAPGLAVQPSIWEDDGFALVSLDDSPRGYLDLLPLVEHAHAFARAAGLGADRPVEINSLTLGFVIDPGESDRYIAMLTELASRHDVVSFWADGAGDPIDGIEKVQIVAPSAHHRAIERVVRDSGLHIADLPVRFLEH